MMKRLAMITGLAVGMASFQVSAQSPQGGPEQKAYIDVKGHARAEADPDEIQVAIILHEKLDVKEKVSVEKQEKDLKKTISSLGIAESKLTNQPGDVLLVHIKKKKSDAVTESRYFLTLNDVATAAKLFDKLDELNIDDYFVVRATYSKMEDLQKQVDANAVKDAKAKADNLLTAAGKKTGSPLRIEEGRGHGKPHDKGNDPFRPSEHKQQGGKSGDIPYGSFQKSPNAAEGDVPQDDRPESSSDRPMGPPPGEDGDMNGGGMPPKGGNGNPPQRQQAQDKKDTSTEKKEEAKAPEAGDKKEKARPEHPLVIRKIIIEAEVDIRYEID